MIRLIYNSEDELVDCEYGHNKNDTKLFLINLHKSFQEEVSSSNISVQPLDDITLSREFQWMNYSYLRQICRQKHHEIRKQMQGKLIDKKYER